MVGVELIVWDSAAGQGKSSAHTEYIAWSTPYINVIFDILIIICIL